MAAFDNFRDMYDIALKPRLLRTLVKERVPDEKRPFRSPSELLHVVSAIKTHGLLSECYVESVDQKQVQNWKSAVDYWADHLLVLVSGNMPDKCWAGISLLGFTCEECHSDRFLASYSVWFHKLLPHIQQQPVDSQFVKLATCTSISDLFTRLGGFSNLKKDAISHAGKVVQPVLKLLNDDSSEAVWEGAIHLLCTILALFPSSLHRHYDTAEAAIVSKIKSGKCSESMLKKLAHCLALLPKSRGDEDSWSLLMQKILLSVNVHLNDAFQGLEEETKSKEAMRFLALPGKDPPPPLGGHMTSGEALDNTTRKSKPMSMSSVSTLMLCCSTLLTNFYPVQIAVPVRPLLALVERVLMVDGSVSQTLFSYMTAMQQQLICSQLPALHMHSLDLLTAIIKGLRSQLLQHAAEIVRLLTEYFRRCALPELRIKVYSIIKILLISMGVGIAVYLAPEVINNAVLDLNSTDNENYGRSEDSAEASLQPNHRKRKQVAVAWSHEERHETIGVERGALNRNPTTPNSVKIAALEALEALLTVGGASKSESWRLNVDLLLITVATHACGRRWANKEINIFLPNEHTSTWADFQLASLRALLASFLSRARVWPPYLAQGLELFRRGKQETGTRLAEFCAHALLALEVLIHPRARSLGDFSSGSSYAFDEADNKLSKNLYSGGQKRKISCLNGVLGMGLADPDSDEDDLYRSWLENGDETEVPVADSGDNNLAEEPFESFKDHSAEKLLSFDVPSNTIDLERSKQGPAAVVTTVKMRENVDEIMPDAHQNMEPTFDEDVTVPAAAGGSIDRAMEPLKVPSDSGALDPMKNEISSGKGILANEVDRFDSVAEKAPTLSFSEYSKALELDNESSMDSFPDIVDADPDSD